MAKGILKTNGVHLQRHEYETVQILIENGFDIELIPGPSVSIKGLQIPDIMINDMPWEIKAP